MDVFRLRDTIIDRYSDFVTSFVRIKDPVLRDFVDRHIESESLWPEPLIQLNPAFQNGGWIDELVSEGMLHKECSKIFRVKDISKGIDKALRLLNLPRNTPQCQTELPPNCCAFAPLWQTQSLPNPSKMSPARPSPRCPCNRFSPLIPKMNTPMTSARLVR